MSPRHALLALGLSLVLAALTIPAPAAAMDKCTRLGDLTTVCVDRTNGACVWATQFDSATDFGTIEKACATLTGSEGDRQACVTTIAGMGTFTGFYGHHQTTCVAVYEWNGQTCATAWGDAQGVAWMMSDPYCV